MKIFKIVLYFSNDDDFNINITESNHIESIDMIKELRVKADLLTNGVSIIHTIYSDCNVVGYFLYIDIFKKFKDVFNNVIAKVVLQTERENKLNFLLC